MPRPPRQEPAISTSLPNRPAYELHHKILVGYVVVMMLMFLVPVPTTPLAESRHIDKLIHFGVFAGFALLFHLDRAWRVRWTLLISIGFAGGIELVQGVLPYREGDWADFVAGAAGSGLGAVLVLLIDRHARRVAASSINRRSD